MNKIVAREVPPEQIDFSFYFDDDGFTNRGGENCAIYIVSYDRNRLYGFNIDEYKDIQEEAEQIIDDFEYDKNSIDKKYIAWMKNATEYLENHYQINTDLIAEYLTIKTGVEWKTRSFYGYSQGDYCEVVYCSEHYKNGVEEIGKMWLGCGTEFCIDDCYGYYVTDDIRWAEDEKLINCLAEMYGCDPKEMEVQLYAGEQKTAIYKTLTE